MAKAKIECMTLAIDELTAEEVRQMYHLFEQYYDAVSFETFTRDLYKKDKVLVARDHEKGKFAGFTTVKIMKVPFEWNGRTKYATGIFSGDTIVSPEYWGQRIMNAAFAAMVFKEKCKRPFSPLYWFLISKGYKTYLLLTNNFDEYYPNLNVPTPPKIQKIIDSYATQLYPENYDPEAGLLRFEQSQGNLKNTVAPIDDELMDSQPNVAFFQAKNPDWQKGNELVCLGVVDWPLFAGQVAKEIRHVARLVLGRSKAKTKPARSEA